MMAISTLMQEKSYDPPGLPHHNDRAVPTYCLCCCTATEVSVFTVEKDGTDRQKNTSCFPLWIHHHHHHCVACLESNVAVPMRVLHA